MDLPDGLLALLKQPSPCYFATTMPDGSPQLTQTWVDTDGKHVLINTVDGHVKVANIQRDPRIALTVTDREKLSRYYQVRGRVVDIATDGAAEHIDELSRRYTGRDYPWWGGRDQVRLLLTIEADRITSSGG